MWIARDKDGEIHLFYNKPHRDTVYGGNYWTIDVPDEIKEYTKGWDHYDAIIGYWMKVNTDKYPNLKWEDEPLEVDFNVTYNPNIKYYEIIKKKDFYLVIILSIGQTGEYWKYLLEDVKDCKVPIYFDFLYRNGSMNRLFVMGDDGLLGKAITTDRSLIKKLTQLTHDYFVKNKEKLKGSVLTKSQLKEYGI